MYNLPYQLQPQNWSEYRGHSRTVRRAEQWITTAPQGMPRSIFVSGPSGVGKSAFVILLIKSAHCMGRADNDPNPCGKCDSCRNIDVRLQDRRFDNVHWIQPGGFNTEETIQASVKMALSAGAEGPRQSGHPQRDILFLVFDEWQKIDSRSRQQILIRSEVETDQSVCYIFITMQPEDLRFTERVASIGRCQAVNLLPFTAKDIEESLLNRLGEERLKKISPAALRLIAEHSKGSLRMAYSLVGNAMEVDEYVTEEVAAEALQAASTADRVKLWELLESPHSTHYHIKDEVDRLMGYCEPVQLVTDLQKDLLYSGAQSQKVYEAYRLLREQSVRNPMDFLMTISALQLVGVKGVAQSVRERNDGGTAEKRLGEYSQYVAAG